MKSYISKFFFSFALILVFITSISVAQIISTDQIRKDLYGDDSRQGDWDEVEERMHEKIINSISKSLLNKFSNFFVI